MLRRWRVKRAGPGRFRLNLPVEERDLLGSLVQQLQELVEAGPDAGDGRVRRLFPTAYADDPERDAEYQRFMREELVASHLGALARVRDSLDGGELTESQLLGWVQSINALRLILGTMLDVSEDDQPVAVDDDPGLVLYAYLSGLLDEMVGVL